MEGALGEFCHIQPSLIIAAGIAPTDLVHQNHVFHQHPSTTDTVFQGIVQTVFHRVHALLADGSVEDGFRTVLVHEDDAVIGGHYAVGMGFQALGDRKLITCLEAFALSEFDFLSTPVLVGHRHTLFDSRTRDVDMNHRFPYVGPQLYRQLPVADLYVALLQMQCLTEVLHI